MGRTANHLGLYFLANLLFKISFWKKNKIKSPFGFLPFELIAGDVNSESIGVDRLYTFPLLFDLQSEDPDHYWEITFPKPESEAL